MNLPDFEWQRRWLKQVEGAKSEEPNPLAEASANQSSTFADIASIPCLVLLGSPGIGKSHELAIAYENALATGNHALLVALRTVRGPNDLQAAVTKSLQELAPDQAFALFLDGLDEAAVPVAVLFEWLVNTLRTLLAARRGRSIFVRLTSRNAVWQTSFENDLRSLCGQENVATYELCPLTAEDLQAALTALPNVTNVPELAQQLGDTYSAALFRLPITFRMFLDIFISGDEIPRRRIEIYRRALIVLLDRERDRSSANAGTLASEERLLIAARLAACAILSNRHTIWTGVYSGAAPDTVLAIQEIAGGEEQYLGASFRVTENELKQVVESGIFIRLGNNLYTWAHLSFAEFLAGYYLASKAEGAQRIVEILSTRTDDAQRLAPQMREVAAWSAALLPELFDTIVKAEPILLLNSDAFAGDERATRALVDAMFAQLERDEGIGWYSDVAERLARLAHPGLAEQLRAIISNHCCPARN